MDERDGIPKECAIFGQTPHDLMELHLQVMFKHDESNRNRLRRVNEPWPSDNVAPRFVLGRPVGGVSVCRFGHGVPNKLVEQLKNLCAEEPPITDIQIKPKHLVQYMDILQAETFTMGPCWVIEEDRAPPVDVVNLTQENMTGLLQGSFETLISRIEYIQPCVAVILESQAVSICCSVRISKNACEAGVETLEGFRGKGYATAAVSGWATAVREMQLIPLYSTLSENVSSQAVAQKLSMRLYGVNFTVK